MSHDLSPGPSSRFVGARHLTVAFLDEYTAVLGVWGVRQRRPARQPSVVVLPRLAARGLGSDELGGPRSDGRVLLKLEYLERDSRWKRLTSMLQVGERVYVSDLPSSREPLIQLEIEVLGDLQARGDILVSLPIWRLARGDQSSEPEEQSKLLGEWTRRFMQLDKT